MNVLSLMGGIPTIASPIAIDRNKFDELDKLSLHNYLQHENTLSYYGDEGLQRRYEKELANYFEKEYCVLVNSGTNALLAAYFAIGLAPGDEVIVPTHAFFAISSPLLFLGINVIICDCEVDTGLLDIEDLKKKITLNTKAVVVNHLCGDCADMNTIARILEGTEIVLIEDVSLAFGATYFSTKLGSFGHIACFSLGSTKMLSGGQGGAIVTNNREYYERIILLGCFGKRAKQNVLNPFYRQFANTSYGLNIRMHSLAIAVSYGRFLRLDQLIEQRQKCYHMLSDTFSCYPFVTAPREQVNRFRGSWHGYYLLYDESHTGIPIDLVTSALRSEGLQVSTGCHYMLLNQTRIHQTVKDGYRGQGRNPNPKTIYSQDDCPKAALFNNKTISFPLFLNEYDLVNQYCVGCKKVFDNLDELRRIDHA